jgi:hypothetical protein
MMVEDLRPWVVDVEVPHEIRAHPEVVVGSGSAVIGRIEQPGAFEDGSADHRVVGGERVAGFSEALGRWCRAGFGVVDEATAHRHLGTGQHAEVLFDQIRRDLVIVVQKQDVGPGGNLQTEVSGGALARGQQVQYPQREIGGDWMQITPLVLWVLVDH